MTKNLKNLKKNYCIYVYEFKTNEVYVGLTNNVLRRDNEHRYDTNDNLYKICVNNNIEIPDYKILEDNLNMYEAQTKEANWIKYYFELGYIILNKAKCGLFIGSVGGNDNCHIQTIQKIETVHNKKYEECLSVAQQCTTLSDFRKKYHKYYEYSRKYGWLQEYTWLKQTKSYRKKNKKLNKEKFLEIASQYKTKTELALNEKTVYMYGLQNNLLNKVYDMSTHQESNDYSIDYCLEEMNKYQTKTEFSKMNSKIYNYCRINGLLKMFKTKDKKQNEYIKVNKYALNDVDLTSFKEIEYNGENFFIDTKNYLLYKPLKTRINSRMGKYNANGIYCFVIHNNYIPYHSFLTEKPLVKYKDNDFTNLNFTNLEFCDIDLQNEFKPIKELKTYFISKNGEIYSQKDKVIVKLEIKNNEYYFKGFNVSKLICKYWKNYDSSKMFDVVYNDGNTLNINLENLSIVSKKCKIHNIKIDKYNGHSEIKIKDFLGNEYFIGSINNEKILKQIHKDLKNRILVNPNITEWINEYREEFTQWKTDDELLTNIRLRTESCGCYWSEVHKSWKSKIYYNDKEYSLGYFSCFEMGKLLYEEATLHIKYGTFTKWYSNIENKRNEIRKLFN